MRGQYLTPVAHHIQGGRTMEGIGEAKARGVEKWVKGVKVSDEVASEVDNSSDEILQIINLGKFKNNEPKIDIIPYIFKKYNEILPIIEDLKPKKEFLPLFTDSSVKSKDWRDDLLGAELAKKLGLSTDATWGDLVRGVGSMAEKKSRGIMGGEDFPLKLFKEYPKIGKDGRDYYDDEALTQTNAEWLRMQYPEKLDLLSPSTENARGEVKKILLGTKNKPKFYND